MPAIGQGSGKSAAAERKVRVKAKPKPAPKSTGYTLPKVKHQPGPFTNKERKAVAKQKTKPSYKKALNEARTHGSGAARYKNDVPTDAEMRKGRKVSNAEIKKARIKVIRRTRPKGNALIEKLATKAIHGAVIPSTGAGPNIGTRLAGKVTGANYRIATAENQTYTVGKGAVGKVAENTLKDAITFPAQAVSTAYDTGRAAVEAAHGDTRRAKRIVHDFKQGDPVYNAAAAGVEKLKGNDRAAKSHLKKAEKAVEEHPGLTALEVAGVKGAVGRGLGRAIRGTGKTVEVAGKVTRSESTQAAGRRVHRVASTRRAPKRVEGTNITVNRSYSPDVITKAGQVSREKIQRGRMRRLERKATTAAPERAQELRQKAARINPDRVSEREIKRRVDERVAVNEDIRRQHRAEIVKKARKIIKSAGRDKSALSVVAQRITRADKEDLRSYVKELENEFPTLSNAQKAANKALRKRLNRAIKHGDLSNLEHAARDYEKLLAPLQKQLTKHKLIEPERADRAKLIPYAVRNMGARHVKQHYVNSKGDVVATSEFKRAMAEDPTKARAEYTKVPARLVSKDGEPISNAEIRAHMEANGVKEPAFVTQAPNQRGARNFNVRPEKAQAIIGNRRTGEATRKGTFDAHPETLVENAAKSQGLVDATKLFRRTIKEFAHRKPNGKVRTFKSYDEALQAAKDLVHDENGDPIAGAHALRPVLLNPHGAPKEQLHDLLNEVDNPRAGSLTDNERAALTGKTKNEGKWALIPEAAADRLVEHLDTQGGGGGIKAVQLANQAFRKTVLSTSPSWFAGNIIEGLGRAALAHAGPRSYIAGRRVMKRLHEISPAQAEEAAYRMIGGGHLASADRLHIRRGAEQFSGTTLAPVANALGKFWRAPGPKQAAGLWNAWTDFAFKTVNGKFESHVQTAMLGKALRKSELMDGHLIKLNRAAIDDAAKGLTKTENQVEFGRAVDRMFGKYSKFSPDARKAIATYTPFIAWASNAVYFVYRTLPRDHPVTTAAIASLEQANEDWRRIHGLDQWMGKGALPGFLQGSIPTTAGGHFRAPFHYTPFGAFGSPSETLAGQVMPLWSGIAANLSGRDWKGRQLTVTENGRQREANELERFAFGARSMLEATVPIFSIGERVVKDGPAALNPLKISKSKPRASGGRQPKSPWTSGSANPWASGSSNPWAP